MLVARPLHSQGGLQAVLYAAGFSAPVAVVQDPTNRSVQVVVEQGGRIRVVESGAVHSTDFLDLRSVVSSGGERGLLGLAFATDYASSGRFFVNFTNTAGHTVIARFKRSEQSAGRRSGVAVRSALGARPACIAQPFA